MLSKMSSAPWGLAAAALVVVLAAVLIINLEGTQRSGVGDLPASPTVAPATAPRSVEPPAVRIACGTENRKVGLTVPIGDGLQSEAGTVLGCSRDGTTLLVRQGLAGGLFVLHPDGMETQVAEGLSGGDVRGSARPSGATISPDGRHVLVASAPESSDDSIRSRAAVLHLTAKALRPDGGHSTHGQPAAPRPNRNGFLRARLEAAVD